MTYEKMADHTESYDSISTYFDSTGIDSVPSSLPDYYYIGETWTTRAVELIDNAEESILIDTFLIGQHENSMRIFTALQKAVSRGVTVRMLVDSASYYRKDRTTGLEVPVPVHMIRDMGIEFIEYNPIRAYRIYRLLGLLDRDHRKFWVIDGKTVVAGGMNIDPDSLGYSYERGSVDGMTEIYSPEAAAILTESFIRTWNQFSLDPLDRKDFPIPMSDQEEIASSVYVLDQNMDERDLTTKMFDSIFSQAEDSITMIQCYLILTPGLLDRIRYACDRGVEVNVILSANHVSDRFTKATYYGIKDMIEAGAKVSIYESPERALLHKKLITADGQIVAVGSANYNFRSQVFSREISLVFDDVEAYKRIEPFIEDILEHSRPVDMEEAEGYKGIPYLLFNLMMQLGG